MVDGCLAWQRTGLQPPPRVIEATAAYRAEEDILARFLRESCDMEAGNRVAKADLYEAYAGWCGQTGENQVSMNLFGRYLKEQRGLQEAKSGSARYWCGIRVNETVAGG